METRALEDLPPTILFEKRDHIAIVTINRPDAHERAHRRRCCSASTARSPRSNDDPDLWVAILTAAGDKAFCCGHGPEGGHPAHDGRRLARLRRSAPSGSSSDVFKPIIAAVNGFCIAGGMEMVLGTDLRIAAEHATLRSRRGALGARPGRRLARAPAAADALGGGDAAPAHRQADRREARLRGRARERGRPAGAAACPARSSGRRRSAGTARSRCAPRRRSPCARSGSSRGFVLEKALGAKVFASEDAKEGPRAFAEKRPPKFKGR